MTTINISIPENLKAQAQELVDGGFYSSFSDFVRDSIRNALYRDKYERWADEAKRDFKTGKGTLLKSREDIDIFFKTFK